MFYCHIINDPFLFICSKHVLSGRVVERIDVLMKIERLSTADQGRPIVPVKISNCGEIFLGKGKGIVVVDEGASKCNPSLRDIRMIRIGNLRKIIHNSENIKKKFPHTKQVSKASITWVRASKLFVQHLS